MASNLYKLEAIAKRLADQSVGTIGSTIYIGNLPETPAACIAVYSDSGAAGVEVFGSTYADTIDQPTFRVTVRAARGTYATGLVKARAVETALTFSNLTLTAANGNSTYFLSCKPAGSVQYSGVDAHENPVFNLSFVSMLGHG
jgi:hypothetical protein